MKKRTALVLLLLSFYLAACAPAATSTPVPTAVPSSTATLMPTDTPVPPTATATVPPTATTPPTDTPTPAPTATRTQTPKPTATSTPATQTYVIFTDDFSTCKLTKSDNETRTMGCENGEYIILNKLANYSIWNYYSESYDDFVVSVDARAPTGSMGVNYGLLFRMSPDGSFYQFNVTTDGWYSVQQYSKATKWTALIPYTESKAIKTGTEKNQLQVIAQGDQFAVSVNGQHLDTVTDSKLKSGNVGVILGSSEANGKAAFDNLIVSKINRPLALPVGLARPPTATPGPAIPPGMGGLIVYNYYGREINYEIGGKLYKIPGNGNTVIFLPPGKQNYSADIASYGRAGGTIEIVAGVFKTQSWADR